MRLATIVVRGRRLRLDLRSLATGHLSATDVDKKTGAVTTDKGKGINIFRRGTDGKWRVAIDGWSSDIPIAK